jgi:hypothetical protein
MFQRIHRIIATAACGLTLALLSGPWAHAAPKTVLSGQVFLVLSVHVWDDTEEGTQLDDEAAKAVWMQYAGTKWTALDNGQVVISKGRKTLAGGVDLDPQRDNTSFLFHGRAGNQIIDGRLDRSKDDPVVGYGEVYVTELGGDGRSSRTAYIQVLLVFP